MISSIRFDAAGSDDIVARVGTVAAAAGWTVDLEEVGRLHIHGPTGHFEIFTVDTQKISIIHCTGFDGGLAPANQPGASPGENNLVFYSSSNSGGVASWQIIGNSKGIWAEGYIAYSTSYLRLRSFGFGVITDKIGNWTGGVFISGGSAQWDNAHQRLFDHTTYYYLMGLVDGAWTPWNAAGTLVGKSNRHVLLRNEQPNYFNGGILPQPVLIFKTNDVDMSLLHPLGYVDGLLYVNGGDVYVEGDEFTIGADTYRYFPDVANIAIKDE